MSTCFSGFKLKRPARFAVGSPKRYAAKPWATSWQTIAGTKQAKLINKDIM